MPPPTSKHTGLTGLTNLLSLNAPTHDPNQNTTEPSQVDAILNHPSLKPPTKNLMNQARCRRPAGPGPINPAPQAQPWYKASSEPTVPEPARVPTNANGARISAYCLGMQKEPARAGPDSLGDPEVQRALQERRVVALEQAGRQKWMVRVWVVLGVVLVVFVVARVVLLGM